MGMHFSLFRKIVSEAHTSPLKMAQNAKIGILVPHAVSIFPAGGWSKFGYVYVCSFINLRYIYGDVFFTFSKNCIWGPYEPSKNGPERQNWDFGASRRLNFPGWWLVEIWLCICLQFYKPHVHIPGCIFHFFEKLCLRPIRALSSLTPSQFPSWWLVGPNLVNVCSFINPRYIRGSISLFWKIVSEAHSSPLEMALNAKIGILVPHAVSISRLMVICCQLGRARYYY